MSVGAWFRTPGGGRAWVGAGELIGRLPTAALHIADPRISEAHAMVSLRGRQVRLLALRGRFAVNGKMAVSIALRPGLEIELSPQLTLVTEEVKLPPSVMGIHTGGQEHVLLGVTSLFDKGAVHIEHGWKSSADAVIWPLGELWQHDGTTLEVGDGIRVGPHEVTMVAVPTTATAATRPALEFQRPLTLTLRFDTVHITREGLPTVVVRGLSARILTEVGIASAPLPWHGVARTLWGDLNKERLRQRWDMQLTRLRRALKEHDIRTDLVQSHGKGLVELILNPADRVVDEA